MFILEPSCESWSLPGDHKSVLKKNMITSKHTLYCMYKYCVMVVYARMAGNN